MFLLLENSVRTHLMRQLQIGCWTNPIACSGQDQDPSDETIAGLGNMPISNVPISNSLAAKTLTDHTNEAWLPCLGG